MKTYHRTHWYVNKGFPLYDDDDDDDDSIDRTQNSGIVCLAHSRFYFTLWQQRSEC